MRKIKLLLCIIPVITLCLSGCSKDKIAETNEFLPDEVLAVQLDVNSWNTNIMASSDDSIHISFDGSISNKNEKPNAILQDGILTILQNSNEKEPQEQMALGKEGQITLYLPSASTIPIKINNGDGDMEIDSLSATNFQLKNNSGYVTVSNLAADRLDVLSTAGDITVKNGNIVNLVIATTSGYVSLKDTTFDDTDIITKSGEVNISQISPNTNTSVQTGSGDINLSYQTAPENLSFAIASGSKDITVHWNGAAYDKETTAYKQGIIGDAEYKLEINSDSGTVVVN